MNTEVIFGVEKIEFGTPGVDYALPTSWTVFNNIEDGSVSYTSNKDTETPINTEDKDVPLLTLFTPGAADVFTFGLVEVSEANLAALFNTTQDISTSTTSVLAHKKRANLAIRLTTRSQFGIKKVFTFPNTICNVAYKNNFTKNALVALEVAASIYPYRDGTNDVLYTIATVNADGSAINGTLPTVSAGANQTGLTTATATLTGTATGAGSNTIAQTMWTKKTGAAGVAITSPNSLSTGITGMVTGTYVFTLTATDSEGNVASADTTVTTTVS